MLRPAILILDGKPYRWSHLRRLRLEQLAAGIQARQLALFDILLEDRQPAGGPFGQLIGKCYFPCESSVHAGLRAIFA